MSRSNTMWGTIYNRISQWTARGLDDNMDYTMEESTVKPSGYGYNSMKDDSMQFHRDIDDSILSQMFEEEHNRYPLHDNSGKFIVDESIKASSSVSLRNSYTSDISNNYRSAADRYPGLMSQYPLDVYSLTNGR